MDNIFSTQPTSFKVADFISWKKKDTLILSPHFQRRSVWKKGAKSFFIDTVFKGLPVPIIFLRDRRVDPISFEPIREVIDGQQRLRTLISFISPDLLEDFDSSRDAFTVSKTHNRDLAGLSFPELPESMQQTLLNYVFSVHVVPASVSDANVIQIFRRMNSTNYNLRNQELLNAQYFGEFKTSQYDLAAEQLLRWRQWSTFTDDEVARMLEVELVSEISASIIERKIMGRSPKLIESFYKTYEQKYQNRAEVEKRIRGTMNFIFDTFPGDRTDFVFFKKTIFYSFFFAIYDSLYGLKSSLSRKTGKKVSVQTIRTLLSRNELIRNGTAPQSVLQSADRRTTNIKERNTLYKFLTK